MESKHFQPMSYPQEESPEYGFFSFFVCIILICMGIPFAKYAMARHSENNYLESNHCKVVAYEVKDISGYKTLWSCDNGHYISEQVSY